MDRIAVGVIGCGYWGPNLIRNFSTCPLTEVRAVCDASPARLEAIGRTYPHVKLVSSVDQLLEQGVQAVAIATPASTHAGIAMAAVFGMAVYVHERHQDRPAMIVRLALVLVAIRATVGISSGSATAYQRGVVISGTGARASSAWGGARAMRGRRSCPRT